METIEQLSCLLLSYDCGISYKPTKTEVSPSEFFASLTTKFIHTIPPITSLVPADEAAVVRGLSANRSTFILVPGRKFDATGTRHGKGAGWYDRFLATVPREWLRIGLCYTDQFSDEPLKRESWDEPMDFICVINRESKKCRILST